MADCEDTADANTSEHNSSKDDVFMENGDMDTSNGTGLLHPEYGASEKVLPRRSSLIKDATRRQQHRKKTVSFSSMPNDRIIINAPDCLNFMQSGSELIKVRSNSRQYHRLFTLDKELGEIRWHPSSKKPHKAKISVEQIREVRVGKNTDVLRNKDIAGIYPDECAFSVIYGENFDSLDLIANSPDEANIWVTGLTCLISGKSKKSPTDAVEERQQMRDRWLQEVFASADSDQSGYLDEFEVIRLVKKLNSGLTTVKVQHKLKELSTRKEMQRGRLTSVEFINLFKEMSTRPEIYFLLVRYASSADFMSTDDLLLFLEAEQGMTRVTKDMCLETVNKFEPSKEGRRKGQLGIDGFTRYLLSEECDIFDPEHKQVCMNMTLPMPQYFVASSHNTYLMEDQLKGPSSVDMYIRALNRGCRCVELDCWDGPNDEPVIYHGHTLTSKISFKAVIEAINTHAFRTSEYPVILSIENHCSIKQQQAMAHCMKSVFGDKLYTAAVDENENQLPSPQLLIKKILIKGKKLSSENTEVEGYVTDEDEGQETDRRKNHKREGSLKKRKLAKELSDLVCIFKSIRFEHFQHSLQKQKCYEMCSFSESASLKLANACPEDFVNHNKRFLSRVYPNGMRVDSSNYNPVDLWNCGCQLVALNYQTAGLMMDLNDGRFRQNGNCGYILKPAIMREEISYFSANTRDAIPGVSPQILHVKIISGQNLPKPKGSGAKGDVTDPYVTVEIFGIPADCAEERTKTIQNNGHNPIWDESFEFQINLPELALVRFSVLDDEFIADDFIGQYTLPFECMQTGYRHMCLMSNNGEPIPNCTLFVHVAITNKRGGGKAHRRGMSVKKSRKHRDYPSMKTIGVKSVDETFKVSIQPLRDATDLRDNVLQSLSCFKENCGLSPISNVKQCIRMLATRIHSYGENVSLQLIMKGEYPYLEAHGNIPESLKKALLSYEVLVTECKALIQNTETVHQRLVHSQQAGMEWYEELNEICQLAGLKGKKLIKATENFAWNIRVLKGQADLLLQAKLESEEYMKQVQEAAVSTGLVKDVLALSHEL